MEWLIYPVAGAAAGLIAGLFGVGGGLILVPVLASVFTWLALAPAHTMQLALGTSLATIIATAASSTRAHQRRGAVRWDIFWRLTPGIVIGTWLGAGIADAARSDHLRIAFGLAECALGLYMWFKPPVVAAAHRLPGPWGLAAVGSGIGTISSLAGIGGGTLTVPFLSRCRLVMTQAVGTSAACGLPIAVAGSISYVLWGWGQEGLPPLSLGYVYWPAALGIVVASVLTAPAGAALAHRLPENWLKRGFAVLLFLLGLKLLLF